MPWGLLHPGLQNVLDTALDAVVVIDIDGLVIGWNGHAETIFGWSADEAQGQRLSEMIIPNSHRDAHERGISHYLATGDGPVLNRRIEVPAINRAGAEFSVELSVTASEQFGDRMFIGFIRDISELKAEAERQQRILQESEHRVKNMLTVVQAIALQTAANSPDMESFKTSFSGRLESLARAHQLLVGQVWQDVAISALADRVLGAEVVAGRARFGGPELLLKAGQVLGLSMILHELYTNAIKYGALSTADGQVHFEWKVSNEEPLELLISWRESRGPAVKEPVRAGYGTRYLRAALTGMFGQKPAIAFHPDGLRCEARGLLSRVSHNP